LWGAIAIQFYDEKREVYRFKRGEVDGEALKAGVAYKLNDKHEFVEA
jgi:hypothetical protein